MSQYFMSQYFNGLLLSASAAAIAGSIGFVTPAMAQQKTFLNTAQEFEANRAPASSIFSPPLPASAQVRQGQRTEQERFLNLRENWQEQKEQLQQDQEMTVPEDADNSGYAAPANETAEQDTPDRLETPF